ncbi:MAG: hypothetical protein J6M47_06070 [Clostridia bacterium]|nr:hypothetical protein [Clostridia bacterium]
MMTVGALLLLTALAMTPQVREAIASASGPWIGAYGEAAKTATVTLREMEIYALQLGVFDSGERAQNEMNRLTAQGVPCMIWQGEQMRIVCDAARDRAMMDDSSAAGMDSCVITEHLPEVTVRLTAAEGDIDDVRRMILLPDSLFDQLLTIEIDAFEAMIAEVRDAAKTAAQTHPDNALYTQLAESLVSWCSLMEKAGNTFDPQYTLQFARVTMCALCRELRMMLTD